MPRTSRRGAKPQPDGDSLWFKDAIIYQLHVRAFADSDDDGIGDFKGLTEKLDYLQDLGVTAIWLLPFYPSPLRDDGYDIADYTSVNADYGTLRDFRAFLRQAHGRGMKVITELVLNHTSDDHPWFQRARRAGPGSRWRRFYVWSETPDPYKGVRIIFRDFETSNWAWDPVADAYYWHRFYSHQPDLNFDNPETRRSLLRVLDFWLDAGVDGLRLDAVPYLFEREGTSCENLPETHDFLKELRGHVDRKFANRMILAEANQWPEDAAAYFGDGDECHMNFHFPLMPRLFMAVSQEDRYPIVDILEQTPEIPERCQWAMFLRNHDELTLEMVTDEDRDYMYRVYAEDTQARINLGIRRRLAPLLGNNRRRIELMNGLLLSLPGAPVIYYGDEIGMGDNIFLGDRNGVRTPMQWSADRNAGFSRANAQRLYFPVIVDPEYHYETVNVEAQQANPSSLLWWMKRIIGLRKRFKAFSRGTLEFLQPENRRVLALIRSYEDERIFVVANLSRFVQYVELDMSKYEGMVPVEMFGRQEFPTIGELPYLLTLGPHAFYWFSLEQPAKRTASKPAGGELAKTPPISAAAKLETIFRGEAKRSVEGLLPDWLVTRRWFGGKARKVQTVRINEIVPISAVREAPRYGIVLARVSYGDGEPETYQLPIGVAYGEEAERLAHDQPVGVIARLPTRGSDTPALLYDATYDSRFNTTLLDAIGRRRRFKGATGEITAFPTKVFRTLRGPESESLAAHLMSVEQSNSSVNYEDRLILKLFRRPDKGINPDLEIGRSLTEQARFANAPRVAGMLEYGRRRGEPMTLGILQEHVANEGDAWEYTVDSMASFMERALTEASDEAPASTPGATSPLSLRDEEPPALAHDLIGLYLQSAGLLGRRTAEMHLALASVADAAFSPEEFTPFYIRSVDQSMRNQLRRVMPVLRSGLSDLTDEARPLAETVLDSGQEIRRRTQAALHAGLSGARIRIHGDYHLGQVLYTGKDFVIIDFEGEPARPLSERRLKRSPLRDVAGMVRSFDYATNVAIRRLAEVGAIGPERRSEAEAWGEFWYRWVTASFLTSYFETTAGSAFLPPSDEEIGHLLEAFLLDKAVYEVGYELNNRPDWAEIPLRGILRLLGVRP
jgi:maltose alpha-D-glucosyltransferase/alpha-amylase